MTKLFIDTEFNGNKGQLISMALVADDGQEWYEVVTDILLPDNSWVKENVIPKLDKLPIGYKSMQESLWIFLLQIKKPFTIVYDWPEDAAHFLNAMIKENSIGICPESFNIVGINFEFFNSQSFKSAIPHNALSDARALQESYRYKNAYL